MLPFIRRKNNDAGGGEKPAAKPESQPESFDEKRPVKRDPPGVQMLKEVWKIGATKKKKEMPPPGVSSDIYCVPKQRQMPPRHGGGT